MLSFCAQAATTNPDTATPFQLKAASAALTLKTWFCYLWQQDPVSGAPSELLQALQHPSLQLTLQTINEPDQLPEAISLLGIYYNDTSCPHTVFECPPEVQEQLQATLPPTQSPPELRYAIQSDTLGPCWVHPALLSNLDIQQTNSRTPVVLPAQLIYKVEFPFGELPMALTHPDDSPHSAYSSAIQPSNSQLASLCSQKLTFPENPLPEWYCYFFLTHSDEEYHESQPYQLRVEIVAPGTPSTPFNLWTSVSFASTSDLTKWATTILQRAIICYQQFLQVQSYLRLFQHELLLREGYTCCWCVDAPYNRNASSPIYPVFAESPVLGSFPVMGTPITYRANRFW